MKYESTILKRLIDTYGVVGNPRYISEIIKEFIVRGKERFPELFTYQADWLAHIDEFGLNPSYTVSYTGHSFYAPNTLESPVKSAILKGQTLVSIYDGYTPINQMSTELFFKISQDLKENTKYMIISYDYQFLAGGYRRGGWEDIVQTSNTLTNKFIFTTKSPVNFKHGYLRGTIPLTLEEKQNAKIVVVEYQDGMENWDIPYFEGMQSVKMPVLKATGKNTFNIKNKGANRIGWYSIPLELSFSGEVYIKGADSLPSDFRVNIFADNREYPLSNSEVKNGYTANFQNTTAIDFHCPSLLIEENSRGNLDDLIENGNIVIKLAEEPYKSNILTVNEDVTLRSNGDICDELNLLTGQLTQRIDENGEVLSQEIVKTVDLSILDQNGQNVKQLMSFKGGTHFNTRCSEGTPLPLVSVSVETDLEEVLMVCSLDGNTL